jgi:hypothetical protein
MNLNYKVSYAFVRLPDTAIADFTDQIIAALTGNAGFPTPPVPLATVGTQKDAYLVKLAATAQGGTVATAAKNNAREVLVNSLRQLAAYVQTVAAQDLELLLTSGFQPTSTNRAPAPLAKPVFLNIENNLAGTLVVRLQTVPNARAYEVQYKNGAGWLPAGIFTQARRIEIGNLAVGTSYTVQVRAVGGSTGYSEWTASEPVVVT